MRMTRRFFYTAAALALSAAPAAAQTKITGAGATFPNIIYQNWILTYNQQNPSVQLNYQSIGSGGGIRQFSDKTVDFGASDAPMTDSAIAAIQGNVLHVPTVLGAVVLMYNLPGVAQQLKFTPALISDIFLGKLTKWNDARIAAVNPGLGLPDVDILVVHRSDGSGTTFIFTDYLSKVSPEWQGKVGKGTSVNWPVGLGGKGNEGVAATVNQTPGAIGYVELAYANSNKLPVGQLQNRGGSIGAPRPRCTTAAAAGLLHGAHGSEHRLPRVDHGCGGGRRVSHREHDLPVAPQDERRSGKDRSPHQVRVVGGDGRPGQGRRVGVCAAAHCVAPLDRRSARVDRSGRQENLDGLGSSLTLRTA